MYEWFSSGTHKTRFSLCNNWIYVPFDHPFVNSQHVEWCPIAIATFFCTSCVCVCRSFCEGLMFTVVNLLTTHIINVLWFLLFSSCRSSIKAGKFEHLRLCPKYGAVFVLQSFNLASYSIGKKLHSVTKNMFVTSKMDLLNDSFGAAAINGAKYS